MAVTLPLRSDLPHYSFRVQLDGEMYGFAFWWNYGISAWMMSISDPDDVPLAVGIRVVVDFPLAARFADSRLPPGTLLAIDTTGRQEDPGLEDLGARVIIVYATAEDIGVA